MDNLPMRNQYRALPDWYSTGDTLPAPPMFAVVGQTWYDEDTDTLTDVPPNVTLGEN